MEKKNKKVDARFRLHDIDATLFESLKYPQAGISAALRLLLYSESAWAFFDDVEELKKLIDKPAVALSTQRAKPVQQQASPSRQAQKEQSKGDEATLSEPEITQNTDVANHDHVDMIHTDVAEESEPDSTNDIVENGGEVRVVNHWGGSN